MTTDDRVMTILERANPVPPDQVPDVAIGAARYLDDIQRRSMTVAPSNPTETPTARRWAMLAAAAAVIAAIVGGALLIRGDDESVVVTPPDSAPITPAPTLTPPTLTPTASTPATSAPPSGIDDATAVATSFFAAYNAGRTNEMLSILSDDVRLTLVYNGLPPDPDNADVFPIAEFENFTAWEHAQGQQWDDPVCDVADEQLDTGATLSCHWETRDVVMQAVDGAPAASSALIVVSQGEIVELHLVYAPAFDTLSGRFDGWLALHHPEIEGALCCGGENRDESERNGRLRAELASQWATWLETWGCEAGGACNIQVDDWVAEYDGQCTALAPADPLDELVRHMTSIPRALGNPAANRLFAADQDLTDDTLEDERVAELQQRRLDAMIELGIDERCHPDVG